MAKQQPACWLGLCTWHSAFRWQHVLLHTWIFLGVWFDVHIPYRDTGLQETDLHVTGKVWYLSGDGTVKSVCNYTSSLQSYELDWEGPLASMGTITSDNILKEAEGVEGTLRNIFRKMHPNTSSFISSMNTHFFFCFRIHRNKPKAILLQAGVRCRFFFFFSVTFTIRCYFNMLVAAGSSVTSCSYCLLINVEKKAL